MNLSEAILLGFVQGLAEFLPVSSSGHLVVLQELMGIVDPSPFFEVFLHIATLLAVFIFFRKRIVELQLHELLLLMAASVPAAVVGLIAGSRILSFFSSPLMVGLALLISGFINFSIEKLLNKTAEGGNEDLGLGRMKIPQALQIGLYQMIALVPGVSRSGATVLGGLKSGLSRLSAFEFSFLASVPVIIGANIYEIVGHAGQDLTSINPYFLAAAFATAFATGFLSLKLLKKMMITAKFIYFAYYCWTAGGLLVVLSLAGVL